ncbi:hypothetical protein BKP37_12845 [Anaerobacillus alkalilacustris]|uniref:Uncharacterized protein n=1 Tax=Anaerobacillus alkalilacustris TaxID=393763 RepID=A0A1S2LKU1_9BACI|nr:hypothetical protein [Anaerobacillus alkalilacustris]OIJ12683.1 hypothetical protein BKP37_12845 [Anaerobacillus alkalilacustris]
MKLVNFTDKKREIKARFYRKLLIIKNHGSVLFATREGAVDFVKQAKKFGVELDFTFKSCGYLVTKKGENNEHKKTL